VVLYISVIAVDDFIINVTPGELWHHELKTKCPCIITNDDDKVAG